MPSGGAVKFTVRLELKPTAQASLVFFGVLLLVGACWRRPRAIAAIAFCSAVLALSLAGCGGGGSSSSNASGNGGLTASGLEQTVQVSNVTLSSIGASDASGQKVEYDGMPYKLPTIRVTN